MVRAALCSAPPLRWKRTGSFHLLVAPKPREDWVLAIVLVRGEGRCERRQDFGFGLSHRRDAGDFAAFVMNAFELL